MKVKLAYGDGGLDVVVPEGTVVVRPTNVPGLADERGEVASSLRPWLAGRRRPRRVAVAFPDLTRPMPNRTVLPPLLAELEAIGAGPDEVVLLCATGTHRAASPEEMAELIGPELVARYRVVQNDATNDDHVEVGRVDGVPILLHRAYVEADLRITTGFVEPHFFAGFSGGPKGVCPGLAALETVLEAHSPARISHMRATWAELDGNPVHEFVRSAVAFAPPTISLDVAINNDRQLTAVFVGPLPDAHRRACAYVERTATQRVAQRFDVVVSTNGGHPLDRNLYQSVKGMAAAERVVRPGGTIVLAAACRDGLPAEGPFGNLLAAAQSPSDLLHPGQARFQDQWQTQVLGRVLAHAQVQIFSEGLSDAEARAAHLEPIGNVSDAVSRAAGASASVCVLPMGPLTVATAADPRA